MKKLLLFCFVLSTAGCHLLDEECGAKCGKGYFYPLEQGHSTHNLIELSDEYTPSQQYVPINLDEVKPTFELDFSVPILVCFTLTGDSTTVELNTADPHEDIFTYPNIKLCKISPNY